MTQLIRIQHEAGFKGAGLLSGWVSAGSLARVVVAVLLGTPMPKGQQREQPHVQLPPNW